MEPGVQAERLAAVREAAAKRGVDLVVNARTDVLFHEKSDAGAMLEQIVHRGRLYRAAGADVFFPIGVADLDWVRRIASEVLLPLNVVVFDGAPSIEAFAAAGAARVSLGPGLFKTAQGAVREALAELRAAGASVEPPA